MKSFVRGCVFAILAAGSASVVDAHDIAVFPSAAADGVRLLVRFGHPGDYQAASAAKLITLDALPPTGERRSLAGRLRPDGLTLVTSPFKDLTAPGTWIFSAFYDNGFYLRTADGRSVNTTRAEYPNAETVTHNIKYGKSLLAVGSAGPGFDRVLGHRLELVPQRDPFGVPTGESLDVVLLYEGKPLAGEAVFIYGEKDSDATTQVTSDAAGIVRLKMDRPGRYLVGAEHEVTSRHPDFATLDNIAATLVFTRR